jgi:hypothetical protein
MCKELDTSFETSLDRIRSAVLRALPSWFRWLLCALVLTGISYLSWDIFRFFGFKSGEWVASSRWGPYFNGGEDVLFLLFGIIGSIYSWVRLMQIFYRRLIAKKQKSKANKLVQETG